MWGGELWTKFQPQIKGINDIQNFSQITFYMEKITLPVVSNFCSGLNFSHHLYINEIIIL